jgi:ribosomal protein L24
MVMAGKDAGLTGTVQKVIRAKNRVIVEGRNLVRASTLRT